MCADSECMSQVIPPHKYEKNAHILRVKDSCSKYIQIHRRELQQLPSTIRDSISGIRNTGHKASSFPHRTNTYGAFPRGQARRSLCESYVPTTK